jgi:hypothetical protein
MAKPRTWLPRAEEILDVLRRMKSKQLDRDAMEELFELQRRAAIDLMTQAGASKAKPGTALTIDRTSLLSWVERIFKDESWQLQRQQETSEELSRSMAEVRELRLVLAKEGRPSIKFPIVEACLRANCASLPLAIRIDHGTVTLHVKDDTPEQMLIAACQLLFELSMALNNDPDGFRDRISADYEAAGLTSLRDIMATLQPD